MRPVLETLIARRQLGGIELAQVSNLPGDHGAAVLNVLVRRHPALIHP